MEIICHDGNRIRHAEKKLLMFHCIDVVGRYDCVVPPNPNVLTWEDVRLANVIGARSRQDYWRNLVGKSLAGIPRECDLITMPDQEWKSCQAGLREILQELLDNPGIACAVLTKALHRKRPSLLPVCDNIIVSELLPGSNPKSADTILGIMQLFREVGITNLATLGQIRTYIVQQNNLPDLTNVRMLEALYWMENMPSYIALWRFMERLRWWR